MLQTVKRDTTKEVNFRGKKIAPVVKLGHSKIDTLGYYLNEDGSTSYMVVNQMGDTLEMEATNFVQAHSVKPKTVDFSFIATMRNIEKIKPCDQSFVEVGNNETASDIINSAGTIEVIERQSGYAMDLTMTNITVCVMIPFSIMAFVVAVSRTILFFKNCRSVVAS